MSDNTQELREAVKDGLANHTGEFANPWIFKGHYSHELLADILNDIMASERLFKNLEALIKSQTNQAVLEALDRVEKEVIGENEYQSHHFPFVITDKQEKLMDKLTHRDRLRNDQRKDLATLRKELTQETKK